MRKMNHKFESYESYKGVPLLWLNEIPTKWDVKRAKSLYAKVNRPVRDIDEVVTCFRDGVVTLRKNRRTTGFTESIKEIGYQGIRKGDLVIHVMDAFAGAVGVSDSDGKSTPVYSVCKPKADLNNYYYAYVVREMAKSGFIQSLYRGVRERSSDFRFEVFANQYLPVPPRKEQDQIVKYLDYKVEAINKFIKTKQKLIMVLKEQKQVVINNAVTKGINPSVKMHSVNINSCLESVPEHWRKYRLKNVVTINGRIGFRGYTQSDIVNEEEGAITLSPGNIQNQMLKLDSLTYISWEKYYESPEIMVEENDVLLVKTGSSFGKATLVKKVNYPMTINPQLVLLKNCKAHPEYFEKILLSSIFKNQISRKVIGGATPTVGQGVLGSIVLYMPELEEQERIIQHIKNLTSDIDKSIETIEKEIELITEYRTSLISQVVTGKINVSEIALEDAEGKEKGKDIMKLEEVLEGEECEV